VKTAPNDDHNITEEQVARYLRNHPGFFLRHEDLLADLKLSHNTGKAVSLLERQVEILRERNREVRQRLNALLENAQRNDRLFDKTRQLVLALLEAGSAEALAEAFDRHLREQFELDLTAFIVFHPPQRQGGRRLRQRARDEAEARIGGLLRSQKAICGVLRPEENEFLFGEQAGSAAVVPLQGKQPLGVIAIASRDPQYFRSSMDTLFLSYLADIIVRLLPRHLRTGPDA
jgi:uncharacterized protein